MRAETLIALAASAALGLTACGDRDNGKAGAARFCTPFAETQPGAPSAPGAPAPAVAAADPASALDDCLHRWGYSLAGATDRADIVAQAAVAACAPALSRWNQQGVAAGGAQAQPAPSLLTGQATTPIAEHYVYAQGRALFYVVQARAGKCPPPPAAMAGSSGQR